MGRTRSCSVRVESVILCNRVTIVPYCFNKVHTFTVPEPLVLYISPCFHSVVRYRLVHIGSSVLVSPVGFRDFRVRFGTETVFYNGGRGSSVAGYSSVCRTVRLTSDVKSRRSKRTSPLKHTMCLTTRYVSGRRLGTSVASSGMWGHTLQRRTGRPFPMSSERWRKVILTISLVTFVYTFIKLLLTLLIPF